MHKVCEKKGTSHLFYASHLRRIYKYYYKCKNERKTVKTGNTKKTENRTAVIVDQSIFR